jgi:MoaA/NifB/PqqE/SkfB family radical SAM enzyme
MKFDISNVKVLHLEPTSRCNAACPQCARFLLDGITVDPRLNLQDLSLDKIKVVLTDEFISNLDKMFMCGSFGDPAASAHTLAIYDWFRYINPDMILGMNTNGSLRSQSWWRMLGTRLNKAKDYCVFSIDGLSDTNHIYRRNTQWDKIMKNAQTFINAGGHAHWDMLIFKHNQHQIEEAKQLAKDMGFNVFRAKVSRRFTTRPIDFLEVPDGYENTLINTPTIKCHALEEKSLYMDYSGKLWPCCFIGTDPFNPEVKELNYKNFDNIIDSWKTKTPINHCVNSCSVKNNQSNFAKQWVEEIYFK